MKANDIKLTRTFTGAYTTKSGRFVATRNTKGSKLVGWTLYDAQVISVGQTAGIVTPHYGAINTLLKVRGEIAHILTMEALEAKARVEAKAKGTAPTLVDAFVAGAKWQAYNYGTAERGPGFTSFPVDVIEAEARSRFGK
jgi:hypothetical protein